MIASTGKGLESGKRNLDSRGAVQRPLGSWQENGLELSCL